MGGFWRDISLLLLSMHADHERLLADGFVVLIACIGLVTIRDG